MKNDDRDEVKFKVDRDGVAGTVIGKYGVTLTFLLVLIVIVLVLFFGASFVM